MAREHPQTGYYGTDSETFYVGKAGGIWLVQAPGMERPERIASLPADAVPLSEAVCGDIELPEEAE